MSAIYQLQTTAFTRTLLTASDAGAARSTLNVTGFPIEPGSNIVFEGHSIVQDADIIMGEDGFPVQFMALEPIASLGLTKYNVSNPGDTIADIISQYTAEVYPKRPAANSGTPCWLVVMIGTNDLNSSDIAGDCDDLEAYLATARTDGFTVVLATCLNTYQTGENGVQADNLRTLNAWARTTTAKDYLWEVNGVLPNAFDTEFFYDGVHPTEAGNGELAKSLLASIRNGISTGLPVLGSDPIFNTLLLNRGDTPSIEFQSRNATTNNKRWYLYANGSAQFGLQAFGDTTGAAQIFLISRSGISAPFGLDFYGNITAASGTINAEDNLIVGGLGANRGLQVGNGGYIRWTDTDKLLIFNSNGSTLPFIQLGGTTSSFPGMKNSGATLAFRAADDSGDCAITAGSITASAGFVGSGASITSLTASNLSSGTVPAARLPKVSSRVASDQTSTSTSLADVTGLTASVAANKKYFFKAGMHAVESAAGEAIGFAINGPAGMTNICAAVYTYKSAVGAMDDGIITAVETAVIGTTGGITVFPAEVSGYFETGGNAGTFAIRYKAETGGANSVTVKAGSFLILEEVQ